MILPGKTAGHIITCLTLPKAVFQDSATPKHHLKNAGEKLLSGALGEKLDKWLMTLTLKYWKQKFTNMHEAEFEHSLRTRRAMFPSTTRVISSNACSTPWKSTAKHFESDNNVRLQHG